MQQSVSVVGGRPPENRLHGHCRDVPPAEFETAFYAAQQTDPAGVGNPNP